MTRRIPVFATLVVLAAVVTMIGLGVWQLQRMQWKHSLIAQYGTALASDDPIAWPTDPARYEDAYFRRSSADCTTVTDRDGVSGRNLEGDAGWVQIVHCLNPDGDPVAIQLGWSRDPAPVEFKGGTAVGRLAPYGDALRLIADPPLAGLTANAAPDPRDLPDNHFAYAMQWFFFAFTALVIYGLALRRRLAPRGKQG